MSLGLFVEGKSDKDAIPKLVRKFLDPSPKIVPRTIHRGEMFNPQKVKPHKEIAERSPSFQRFCRIVRDP